VTEHWLTGIAALPGSRYRLTFTTRAGNDENPVVEYDFRAISTDGISEIRQPPEFEGDCAPRDLANSEIPQLIRTFRALELFDVHPQELRATGPGTYRLRAKAPNAENVSLDMRIPDPLALPAELQIAPTAVKDLAPTTPPTDIAELTDVLKRLFCHFHRQHENPIPSTPNNTPQANT